MYLTEADVGACSVLEEWGEERLHDSKHRDGDWPDFSSSEGDTRSTSSKSWTLSLRAAPHA